MPRRRWSTRVREMYAKREVEYPVDFAMDMTTMLMRQDPSMRGRPAGQVGQPALRAGLDRRHGQDHPAPAHPRAAQEKASRAGRLRRAGAGDRRGDRLRDRRCARGAPGGLRYGVPLPHWMRFQKTEEDREDAIRGRIESVLRAELLQFEQTMVLLETLDSDVEGPPLRDGPAARGDRLPRVQPAGPAHRVQARGLATVPARCTRRCAIA